MRNLIEVAVSTYPRGLLLAQSCDLTTLMNPKPRTKDGRYFIVGSASLAQGFFWIITRSDFVSRELTF